MDIMSASAAEELCLNLGKSFKKQMKAYFSALHWFTNYLEAIISRL